MNLSSETSTTAPHVYAALCESRAYFDAKRGPNGKPMPNRSKVSTEILGTSLLHIFWSLDEANSYIAGCAYEALGWYEKYASDDEDETGPSE